MQVSGSGIISETLPKLHYIIVIGFCKVFYGWVTGGETYIIIHALFHTGLLHDDFGKPDEVRVFGISPRQIALIDFVPRDYFIGKRIHRANISFLLLIAGRYAFLNFEMRRFI